MNNEYFETSQQLLSAIKKTLTNFHVNGLNSTNLKDANTTLTGFVGQKKAWLACSVVVDMIRRKKMSGRVLLLSGSPGSGKTTLMLGITQELGTMVPFYHIDNSQRYYSKKEKNKKLLESFRRSISLCITENIEIYEGEIIDFIVKPDDSSKSKYFFIKLKIKKETKQLKLDSKIYEVLLKEKIELGDIINIEINKGLIKRIRRCKFFSDKFESNAKETISLSTRKRDIKKLIIQNLTLNNIELIKSNLKKEKDMLNIIQILKEKNKSFLEIDKFISKYLNQGLAELKPGILFIDEIFLNDTEFVVCIDEAFKSLLSPTVVFTTSRRISKLCGIKISDKYKIPTLLLNKFLIIQTSKYEIVEIIQILSNRAFIDGIIINKESLYYLGKIGIQTSLRHAILLIKPSMMYVKIKNKNSINISDIKIVYNIFNEVSKLSKLLVKNKNNNTTKKEKIEIQLKIWSFKFSKSLYDITNFYYIQKYFQSNQEYLKIKMKIVFYTLIILILYSTLYFLKMQNKDKLLKPIIKRFRFHANNICETYLLFKNFFQLSNYIKFKDSLSKIMLFLKNINLYNKSIKKILDQRHNNELVEIFF